MPTITWPSHTTIITGADPVAHGILEQLASAGRPVSRLLTDQSTHLIGAAHNAGLTIATITWPVTVNAPVDWNLPEFFVRAAAVRWTPLCGKQIQSPRSGRQGFQPIIPPLLRMDG